MNVAATRKPARLSIMLSFVRIVATLALLATGLPLAGIPGVASGAAVAETAKWGAAPAWPGRAATAPLALTLTRTAPAVVWSSDRTFNAEVAIANPSGATIAVGARLTDTVPAGQGRQGGSSTYPWWFTGSGNSNIFGLTDTTDDRTAIDPGWTTVRLTLPITDHTVLTFPPLCFRGTVGGAAQAFCQAGGETTEVRAPAFSFDVTPGTACAGGTITYTFAVSNSGGVATSAPFTMSAQLDPRVTYQPGSASNGGSYSGGLVRWVINSGLLPDGQSLIARTFAVAVPGSLQNGESVTHTFVVSSPEVTPAATGDRATRVRKVAAQFTTTVPGCANAPVTFTGVSPDVTPADWTWDFHDGGPVGPSTTASSITHTYPAPGVYTVTLTVNGDCSGATQSDTYTTTVAIEGAMPSFDASAWLTCVGSPVVFTSTSWVTATSAVYGWDFGDGASQAGSEATHAYAAPGSYTVTLAITTAAGCTAQARRQVSVEVVQASFAASSLRACAPATLAFTSTSHITATGVATYAWRFGDGGSGTGSNVTHGFSAAGSYPITLTVTTPAGCTSVATATVSIEAVATVAIQPSRNPVCVGETAWFTATGAITATEAPAYFWSFGDGVAGPGPAVISHTYATSATYTVGVTTTTSGGCQGIATLPFAVQDSPHVDFGSNAPVCLGQPIQFADESTGGALRRWDFGDGILSAAANPTHTFGAAGLHVVTLTVTSTAGCAATYTDTVGVQAAVAAFTVPTAACVNTPVTFTNASVLTGTLMSYVMDFGAGAAVTGTLSLPDHWTYAGYAAPGLYTAALTITLGPGCTAVYTQPIRVERAAAAFNYSTGAPCAPATWWFTSTGAIDSGGPAVLGWDFGDGAQVSGPATAVSHTYAAGNPYTVTLTVTTTGGCTASTSHMLWVEQARSVPLMSAAALCLGDTLVVTSTGAVVSQLPAAYGFAWGDGMSNVGPQVAASHTYTQAGVYSITLTTTTGAGCTDVATRTVNVQAIDVRPFDVSRSTACVLQMLTFTDTSVITSATPAWAWNFGDGSLPATGPTATHAYTAPGNYTVTLSVGTPAGCTAQVQRAIAVEGIVADYFVSANFVCLNGDLTFLNQSLLSGTLSSLLWDFGDGTTSTDHKPVHPFTRTGLHNVTLTLTSTTGCSAVKTGVVFVESVIPGLSAGLPACALNPVTFDNHSVITGTVTAYRLDFGDGQAATGPVLPSTWMHTYVGAGAYTATLAVTTTACASLAQIPVTIGASPVPSFTMGSPVCLGQPMAFTNTTPGSGLTFGWDFADGGKSTLPAPTHTYAAAGAYTVTLTVTNPTGCTSSVQQRAWALTVPLPQIGLAPTMVNVSQTVTLSDTGTGGTAWSWVFGDGGVATGQSVTHAYTAAGTFTVSLQTDGGAGCTAIATRTVNVSAKNWTRVYAPIVAKNLSDRAANLVVDSVGWVGGSAPTVGQPYHIQVVVRNAGPDAIQVDFWVDLYLNPTQTPSVGLIWPDLSQSGAGPDTCANDTTCFGRAWLVRGLAAGATATLRTSDPADSRYSRWPAGGAPYASRHSPIVALVDSWPAPVGEYLESNESDNVSSQLTGLGLRAADLGAGASVGRKGPRPTLR